MSRKTLLPLVTLLCLAILASVFALVGGDEETTPQADAADVVIGVSPYLSEAEALKVRKALFRMILEKVPRGSRVTVLDAYHLNRITDFRIPLGKAFSNTKIKTKHFRPKLLEIQRFLDASTGSGAGEIDGRIRLPQFLDLVASSRLEDQPPATVVLFGGALYLSELDGRFSMDEGRIPTDSHLCVARRESVFGVADRRGQLKKARVHYAYLAKPWSCDLHEEPVRRFWSLFIAEQGGELITFAGDLPTVVDRMAQSDARSPWRYDHHCPAQPRLVGFAVPCLQQPGPTGNGGGGGGPPPPPPPTQGPLRIGIRWACRDCDLDLYSRPAAEADELFYRNPQTEKGVYVKDYLKSPPPDESFEWVEYREVEYAAVEAAVNFYSGQAAGGVSGEVRVQAGEKLYKGEFRIEASEGNRGAEGNARDGSQYWKVLDLRTLMRLGEGSRAAGVFTRPEKSPGMETVPEERQEPHASAEPVAAPSSREAGPARGVRILSPKDGSTIRVHGGAPGPAQHPVDGDVYGFDQAEIRRFGLTVEVLVYVPQGFPQGIVEVGDNGTWLLPTAWFGGSRHIVRAVLKDRHGNEIHSHEVNVTVIRY